MKNIALSSCRSFASFWMLVLAVLIGIAAPVRSQQTDRPRNVIFILSDDHRYDFMGFHENALEFLETPAMDTMAGEETERRDEIFYEYYWEWNFPQTPTQFALRTDRCKYIFYYGLWSDGALFDLQEDPMETHDLINDEQYQDVAQDLRGRRFEKRRETGGMTIPLREPRGGQQDQTRPPGEPSTDPLADQ